MSNRPRLIHLLLIGLALAVLAIGAWYYTSASDPVAGIPVRAPSLSATSTPTTAGEVVALYFPNAKMGSDADCSSVFPVSRVITDTVNDSPYTELLKGPTPDELKLGYSTSIPADAKISSITRRKVATGTQLLMDFGPELKNVAGSCRVSSIRAQIEQTALHVLPDPPVSVVISVDGQIDTALQP